MKTGICLALAGMLLVMATGCKTSVNSVENAQKTGQRQMISDQRAVTDTGPWQESLHRWRELGDDAGGFLKVQIELLNTTRSLQRFSYHFEWFDANGMQLTTLAPAEIPDVIQGGEDKFISSVAPTPACKDFRVKFIEN